MIYSFQKSSPCRPFCVLRSPDSSSPWLAAPPSLWRDPPLWASPYDVLFPSPRVWMKPSIYGGPQIPVPLLASGQQAHSPTLSLECPHPDHQVASQTSEVLRGMLIIHTLPGSSTVVNDATLHPNCLCSWIPLYPNCTLNWATNPVYPASRTFPSLVHSSLCLWLPPQCKPPVCLLWKTASASQLSSLLWLLLFFNSFSPQ